MIGIADKNDPQISDFAEKNKALSPVFSSRSTLKFRRNTSAKGLKRRF